MRVMRGLYGIDAVTVVDVAKGLRISKGPVKTVKVNLGQYNLKDIKIVITLKTSSVFPFFIIVRDRLGDKKAI